jgi:hypothetical protein
MTKKPAMISLPYSKKADSLLESASGNNNKQII